MTVCVVGGASAISKRTRSTKPSSGGETDPTEHCAVQVRNAKAMGGVMALAGCSESRANAPSQFSCYWFELKINVTDDNLVVGGTSVIGKRTRSIKPSSGGETVPNECSTDAVRIRGVKEVPRMAGFKTRRSVACF